MLGKVTIIWRPNVWKSSFFNIYTGHKIAIVADEAGTTRDISEYEYIDEENDLVYIISDSGWLDVISKNDEVALDIIERTKRAISESDLLIWLIEYDKITELDEKILNIIRKENIKDVILVANKADNETKVMESYSNAWFWGFEDFFPISTSHNSGIKEIKRFVAKFLTKKWLNYKNETVDDTFIKLSMVWRPNVWKSSLINAITKENRVMVKDFSWTTRDSIDTKFKFKDSDFILIDTAWIRRLSKVWVRNIEDWSVMRTNRAILRSDIVAVIIDWFDWIVNQDLSIISTVLEEKKWLIIVVNKWDKVLAKPGTDKEKMMIRYIEYLKSKIEFLPWVPVVFSSAIDWKRVEEILENWVNIKLERFKRVKTWIFNNFIEQVVYKHPPTWTRKSHSPKIYYWSQVDVNPPKFSISVNNPEHFHFSYKRYLENKIRDNFWFYWTPIVIEFKGRGKTKDITK